MRELENVLERAVTLSTGGVITADNIKVRANGSGSTETAPQLVQPTPTSGPLGDQLEDIEREAIVKALEKTRYNKTAAAEAPKHELSRIALSGEETRH